MKCPSNESKLAGCGSTLLKSQHSGAKAEGLLQYETDLGCTSFKSGKAA